MNAARGLRHNHTFTKFDRTPLLGSGNASSAAYFLHRDLRALPFRRSGIGTQPGLALYFSENLFC
jgi:hypothetical protein